MLNKISNLILVFILIFLSTSPSAPNVSGHASEAIYSRGSSYNNLINRLNENIRKQNELRNKIAAAKDQANTLANQVSYLENQIQLTQLEIEETIDRLSELQGDLSQVSDKLTSVKEDLDYTTKVANTRIRELYLRSFVQPAEMFLTSENFNDYLIRKVYAEAVRSQDVSLLKTLKETKLEYTTQKKTLENKKAKGEELKRKLFDKKTSLDNQRGEKEYLLGVTKNNEQTYQRLLP